MINDHFASQSIVEWLYFTPWHASVPDCHYQTAVKRTLQPSQVRAPKWIPLATSLQTAHMCCPSCSCTCIGRTMHTHIHTHIDRSPVENTFIQGLEIAVHWLLCTIQILLLTYYLYTRSTQPCIPPGSLNRAPSSAGVKAETSPVM